jgi:hypothetical protein
VVAGEAVGVGGEGVGGGDGAGEGGVRALHRCVSLYQI